MSSTTDGLIDFQQLRDISDEIIECFGGPVIIMPSRRKASGNWQLTLSSTKAEYVNTGSSHVLRECLDFESKQFLVNGNPTRDQSFIYQFADRFESVATSVVNNQVVIRRC